MTAMPASPVSMRNRASSRTGEGVRTFDSFLQALGRRTDLVGRLFRQEPNGRLGKGQASALKRRLQSLRKVGDLRSAPFAAPASLRQNILPRSRTGTCAARSASIGPEPEIRLQELAPNPSL